MDGLIALSSAEEQVGTYRSQLLRRLPVLAQLGQWAVKSTRCLMLKIKDMRRKLIHEAMSPINDGLIATLRTCETNSPNKQCLGFFQLSPTVKSPPMRTKRNDRECGLDEDHS